MVVLGELLLPEAHTSYMKLIMVAPSCTPHHMVANIHTMCYKGFRIMSLGQLHLKQETLKSYHTHMTLNLQNCHLRKL